MKKHLTLKQVIEFEDFIPFLKELNVEVDIVEIVGSKGKKDFYVTRASLQLQSDYSYRCVRQAQGAIIDMDTLEIVSVGLEKFFNYQEDLAPNLPTEIYITPKRDGSNARIFYQKDIGATLVSKNGVNFKYKVPITRNNETYLVPIGELVQETKTWDIMKTFMETYKPKETYIFEFTSPENQVVLEYEEVELVAITALSVGVHGDYTEVNPYTAPIGASVRNEKELVVTRDLIESLAHLEGVEGFVGHLGDGQRVKFKTKWYFDLHASMTEEVLTTKIVLNIMKEGKEDDMISYLAMKPLKKEMFINMRDGIKENLEKMVEVVNKYTQSKTRYTNREYYTNVNHQREVFRLFAKSSRLGVLTYEKALMTISYSKYTSILEDDKWSKVRKGVEVYYVKELHGNIIFEGLEEDLARHFGVDKTKIRSTYQQQIPIGGAFIVKTEEDFQKILESI